MCFNCTCGDGPKEGVKQIMCDYVVQLYQRSSFLPVYIHSMFAEQTRLKKRFFQRVAPVRVSPVLV